MQARAWFLRIASVREYVCMRVCRRARECVRVYVRLSPKAINNWWRDVVLCTL